MDVSQVRALGVWCRKQPKLVQKASGMMLNAFAYGTRQLALAEIDRKMVVRNARFVSGKVRYDKTSLSVPISQQRSRAGSVAGPRFSGWVEQELGKQTDRKRISTTASRSGDFRRQMMPSARLKRSTEVVKPGEDGYTPLGGTSNYGGFVAMLFRRKERRLVHIGKGFFKLPRNLNQLAGPTQNGKALFRSLELMQQTKHKQPKRLRWLQQARGAYFKQTDLNALWAKTISRLTTPPSKRV